MKRICFHGAESTGKSVLAEKLATELGLPWVPEFGREYAETFGTLFTLPDLLAIAEGHEQRVQRLETKGVPVAILDTDPLMTAAWTEMLFDTAAPELFAYPKADLYLLFEPDVPWIDDGTRFFGSLTDRARFAALAERMLIQADVPFQRISGTWAQREAQVREVLAGLQVPMR